MEKRYYIGVDVGGTSCKVGVFSEETLIKGGFNEKASDEKYSDRKALDEKCLDEKSLDGKTLDEKSLNVNNDFILVEIPTDISFEGKNILPNIACKIEEILKENKIDKENISGLGMGVPGAVLDESIVNRCVNLGWGVIDVKKEMEALTGFNTTVANDANLAAFGEVKFVAKKMSHKNAVFVTIGTGIGSGIIINGKIHAGANGAAGEIGHIHVNSDETIRCTCGNFGCLEQYASATGLVKLALDKGIDIKDAKEIFDLAKAGNEDAENLVEYISMLLGKAFAKVANVFDPEIFIVGGGVSKAGDYFLEKIQNYFKQYAFHASKNIKFALASLGNDAGIIGGAYLAYEK